jgi:hypothetical protein
MHLQSFDIKYECETLSVALQATIDVLLSGFNAYGTLAVKV